MTKFRHAILALFCISMNGFGPAAQSQAVTPSEPKIVRIAQPSEGYTYFNKPGATIDDHEADVRSCLLDAKDVVSWDELIDNNRFLIEGMLTFERAKSARISALENCMIIRGWRVVALQAEEGQALSETAQSKLKEFLSEQVGAQEPQGRIARIWANEAHNAAHKRSELVPMSTNNGQLSLLYLGKITDLLYPTTNAILPEYGSRSSLQKLDHTASMAERLKAAQRAGVVLARPLLTTSAIEVPASFEKKIGRNLALADLPNIPDGWGLIVMRIEGKSLKNGLGLGFGPHRGPRLQSKKGIIVNEIDFGSGFLNKGAGKDGSWMIRAVPPGEYRLSQMDIIPLYFCLGSPAFKLEKGQIIYAGTFDLSAAAMGPDLAMEPIRAVLAGSPYAERIQPASYVNGTTSNCLGSASIYAIEFPGAPFVEGYEWGSKAKKSLK
jgi:hypothetical protein